MSPRRPMRGRPFDPECDGVIMVAVIGIFGALIGSFLNVVIYRVPLGRSVVAPASACGQCGHPIRWYDNIPVISWLVLRGRCRDCGAHISVRYPLVELAGAVAFVFVALRFVPEISAATSVAAMVAGILALVGYLYFVAIGLALARSSISTLSGCQRSRAAVVRCRRRDSGRFFDHWRIVARSPAGCCRRCWTVPRPTLLWRRPGAAVWGSVTSSSRASSASIWDGSAGTCSPWALGAFLLGGVFGVILLVSRSVGGKTAVPFGPWMLGGAWVGILGGHEIAACYLGLFRIGSVMTARIVGLDIGSASVRAVEVKNPDKPSRMILKTQELPLPEGSVSRGEVIDVSTVSMTIRRLWAMGGFGSKDVVLGMGGPPSALPRTHYAPRADRPALQESLQFHVRASCRFRCRRRFSTSTRERGQRRQRPGHQRPPCRRRQEAVNANIAAVTAPACELRRLTSSPSRWRRSCAGRSRPRPRGDREHGRELHECRDHRERSTAFRAHHPSGGDDTPCQRDSSLRCRPRN